jgi:hypothetical protein
VRQHMHNQGAHRLKTLRREFAQDDDADVTTSDEEDDAQDGKKVDGEMLQNRDEDSDEDNVDWDYLLGAVGKHKTASGRLKSKQDFEVKAGKAKGNSKQTHRKSGRSFAILVARFIGPLVILLLMFVIVFAVFSTTLDDTLVLTSVATAANYRAACARQAMTSLRKLLSHPGPPSSRLTAYWVAMKGAQCMRNHVRLLGFGDETGISEKYVPYTPPVENGAASAVPTEIATAVHDAMFDNACPYILEHIGTMNRTECEAVSGGVLVNGLAAAAEVRICSNFVPA